MKQHMSTTIKNYRITKKNIEQTKKINNPLND